jgi:hypothetical protein
MNKKITIFCFCILLISISVNAKIAESSNIKNFNEDLIEKYNIINKGWMEESNGVKILHLNGSFYEMGYQLGYFLKYDLIRNLRGLLDTMPKNESLKLWNIQKNYIPNEIGDYINGTADAIGLSFDDVGCIWVWESKCSLSCSGVIADGPATKSNQIIHVYSLDFTIRPKDPITGLGMLDDPVLIVANPDNGYAFMYPTFAGYVVESGVNEMGIAISNTASPCKDDNNYGSPVGIRVFDVLYRASNIEEAIDIVNKNKTFGYNFLISDVNKNMAFVIEQTANLSFLCSWNDTNESIRPFFKLNHIIRRTNCFIHPETAATQRKYYNLKDIRYLLESKTGPIYEWVRYRAISRAYKDRNYAGKLDLNNALSLINSVYKGYYGGLVWYIYKNLIATNWYSWYQWSYSPKTGDMLICYSSQDKDASENPYHHFNFFELLEEKPPI